MEGIENPHDLSAGEGKDHFHSLARQGARQRLATR
jgi:hypothetical protein